MKLKSQVLTQASGSIGGITYGHNKGGIYQRARSIPVNPSSPNQVQVRSAMTTIVNRWIDTLTQVQRDAWNLYAANVLTTDVFGDPLQLSGQQWYNACNIPRIQADAKLATSLGFGDAAPTIFDRGDTGSLSIASYDQVTGLSIGVAGAPAWAASDTSFALVFQGRPMSAGREFFNGPYRLVAAVPGNSTTPVTSIAVPDTTLIAEGFPITTGQKGAVAVAVAQADFRLSSRVRLGPVTIT